MATAELVTPEPVTPPPDGVTLNLTMEEARIIQALIYTRMGVGRGLSQTLTQISNVIRNTTGETWVVTGGDGSIVDLEGASIKQYHPLD